MTKQTKLELVQINARLAAENEALRTQLADMQMSLDIVSEAHKNAEQDLARATRVPQRPARIVPQWQLDRAAAMAAAREMAIRSGHAVKV